MDASTTQPQLDDAARLQLALLAEVTRHRYSPPGAIAQAVRPVGWARVLLAQMRDAGIVTWDAKARRWHCELPLVEQAEPDTLTIRLPADPDHRRALRGRIAMVVRECAEDMA